MDTSPTQLAPLIGVEELAAYLGVPVQTVYDWRTTGRAPRAYKFGKHVRFALADVQAWLDRHREAGDPGPDASGTGLPIGGAGGGSRG
jgi:excisionase family DNA binding protein